MPSQNLAQVGRWNQWKPAKADCQSTEPTGLLSGIRQMLIWYTTNIRLLCTQAGGRHALS